MKMATSAAQTLHLLVKMQAMLVKMQAMLVKRQYLVIHKIFPCMMRIFFSRFICVLLIVVIRILSYIVAWSSIGRGSCGAIPHSFFDTFDTTREITFYEDDEQKYLSTYIFLFFTKQLVSPSCWQSSRTLDDDDVECRRTLDDDVESRTTTHYWYYYSSLQVTQGGSIGGSGKAKVG